MPQLQFPSPEPRNKNKLAFCCKSCDVKDDVPPPPVAVAPATNVAVPVPVAPAAVAGEEEWFVAVLLQLLKGDAFKPTFMDDIKLFTLSMSGMTPDPVPPRAAECCNCCCCCCLSASSMG